MLFSLSDGAGGFSAEAVKTVNVSQPRRRQRSRDYAKLLRSSYILQPGVGRASDLPQVDAADTGVRRRR